VISREHPQPPISKQIENIPVSRSPTGLGTDVAQSRLLSAARGDVMNKGQKCILMGMIVMIVAMLAYPPFQLVNADHIVFNMGYGWLFDPPRISIYVASVNIPMLLIQWLGILFGGSLGLLIARSSQKELRIANSNAQNEGSVTSQLIPMTSDDSKVGAGIRWVTQKMSGDSMNSRAETKPAREPVPDPSAQKQSAPRAVLLGRCEMCGRQDASLRVTIMLWVVGLIYFSLKHEWKRTLCSKCRIKYGRLWNLEVWVMGWWSFPYGPRYSREALSRNSRGGVQPVEENAALLSLLAYQFHKQGRYNAAYDALDASQRLKETEKGAQFLEQLREYRF
jgi:hypothetical protein